MSLTASTSPDGRLLQLRVEALVPTIELSAVALYLLRVPPTTLSEALLHVRPRTPRARQQREGVVGVVNGPGGGGHHSRRPSLRVAASGEA